MDRISYLRTDFNSALKPLLILNQIKIISKTNYQYFGKFDEILEDDSKFNFLHVPSLWNIKEPICHVDKHLVKYQQMSCICKQLYFVIVLYNEL